MKNSVFSALRPALLCLAVIIVIVYLRSIASPAWELRAQRVQGAIIVVLLSWGFIRAARMERASVEICEQYREELQKHRAEIMEAFNHRAEDLHALRETAATLARDTAAIATEVALKTESQHQEVLAIVTTKVDEVKDEVKKVKSELKENGLNS